MRTIHLGLLVVASLVVLTACEIGGTQPSDSGDATSSLTTPAPTEEATVVDTTSTAPVEDSTFVSPVSTPDPEADGTAFQSPLPAPSEEPIEPPSPSSSDVGVVSGLLLGGNPPLPAVGLVLRLADVIVDSDGTPVSASLDKQTAPSSLVSEAGQYIFTDVPPGRYAMVVDLISSSVVLRDPASGDDLLVDVAGGEITEMDKLIYPELPQLP
ncbi:hypothetical protein ACFLWA_10765 [Chloroflexota bacterium]